MCGKDLFGKSCSKICLAKIFTNGQRERAIKVYVIIDDQSNRSLMRSDIFNLFDIKADSSPYSLRTCAGIVETAGRRVQGFNVESMNGQVVLPLPTLIECDQIPNDRSEISTPQVALAHPHLQAIASQIPELDSEAPILLLLGRDIIRIHLVRKQINGPHDAPYVQQIDLGWVVVGDVCIGKVHKPDKTVNTFFANTLENGRPSLFKPCPNLYNVRERFNDTHMSGLHSAVHTHSPGEDNKKHVRQDVFEKTKDDEKLAPSIEDAIFLDIMEKSMYKDHEYNGVAPLPFRPQRRCLPNNKAQTLQRFKSLKRSFSRKPEMKDHFFEYMEKIFERGHAEVAPSLKEGEECWYLPLFGVYHPKKPGQIRVVFDSSSQYNGVSLNDILLTGPDLNNSFLGVHLRFRKEAVAITADIQHMFHCFLVRPEDRNFLRFFWYKDNNPNEEVIEYRMKVHIFGNSPSPAVAIFGLRRAAQEGESECGKDAREYVERDFYMDDGLKSLPTAAAADDLL